MRHGQKIEWGGASIEVQGEDGDKLEDVQREAVRMAVDSGWHPRKWYEFWRWSEPRYSHLLKYL